MGSALCGCTASPACGAAGVHASIAAGPELALHGGLRATAVSQPHRDVRRPTPTEGSRARPRTSPGHRPAPPRGPWPCPWRPSVVLLCCPPRPRFASAGSKPAAHGRPRPAAKALSRGFRQEAQATPGQGQQGGAPSHLAAALLHAQEARQSHPGGDEAWQLWHPQLTQAPEPLHWEGGIQGQGHQGPEGLRS